MNEDCATDLFEAAEDICLRVVSQSSTETGNAACQFDSCQLDSGDAALTFLTVPLFFAFKLFGTLRKRQTSTELLPDLIPDLFRKMSDDALFRLALKSRVEKCKQSTSCIS